MADLMMPKPPVVAPPYWTEEREKIQAEAREFAMTEVLPLANDLDKQKAEIPRWFLDRIGEKRYFGITLPAEVGGLGLGMFEYCMITEELARAWMSVASIIVRAQGGGTQHVTDPVRRRELLEKSARGQWIGAAGLSEPNAGSDLANVQTRAVLDGDEWVITGEKRWTGNAKAADYISLLCRTDDPDEGESRSRGMSRIIIEKERDSFPPGMTGELIDKIGYHGFLTWNLKLDGVRVPATAIVSEQAPRRRRSNGAERSGGRGRAFAATAAGLNSARVHTAARAVGLMRGAVEDCIVYAQERVQFKHPIADFQAIRFMIADMAARTAACRAFYQQVAHLMDEGYPCEIEAASVKYMATEMAVGVTGDGIQIHGGNGYTTERSVERYWRDARLTTIFEGTSQIQQRIISDRLLPRSGLS